MSKLDKKNSRKTSVGVAMCRREPTTGVPEILLVKSRLSYNYNAFVFGKYKPWDTEKIQSRMNNTTLHEKLLIWSCDFNKMWDHIWLRIPTANGDPKDTFYQFYINCRNKFERLISKDAGRRLRGLIAKATSVELGWLIPRGRIESGESELECALREMHEETSIDASQYHILHDVKPICASHEDENVTYVCKYFVGWTDRDFTPQINFTNQNQISEICDIAFTPLHKIGKLVAQNKNLRAHAELALKLFKQRVASNLTESKEQSASTND